MNKELEQLNNPQVLKPRMYSFDEVKEILKTFSQRADFRTYNDELKIDINHSDIIWLEQKFLEAIKADREKIFKECIGKESICEEEMFIKENGLEYDNGAKFYSNGYNQKRQEIIDIAKNYGIII